MEGDDTITESHVSDTLRYALTDLWTLNPQFPGTSPLPHSKSSKQTQATTGHRKRKRPTTKGNHRWKHLSPTKFDKPTSFRQRKVKRYILQWIPGSLQLKACSTQALYRALP